MQLKGESLKPADMFGLLTLISTAVSLPGADAISQVLPVRNLPQKDDDFLVATCNQEMDFRFFYL